MAKKLHQKIISLQTKNHSGFTKLKRKGFIAGKYEIGHNEPKSADLVIRETVLQKLFKILREKNFF